MAIRNGDWIAPDAHRDRSEQIAQANDDALREALAAADWDPEPEPEVYP